MSHHLTRVTRFALTSVVASGLVLGAGLGAARADDGDPGIDQSTNQSDDDLVIAFLTEEPEDDYLAASKPLFGSASTVNSSLSSINAKSPLIVPVSKNNSTAQNNFLVQSNNNLVANQSNYLAAINCNNLKQARDFWAGQRTNDPGTPVTYADGFQLGQLCNSLGIR